MKQESPLEDPASYPEGDLTNHYEGLPVKKRRKNRTRLTKRLKPQRKVEPLRGDVVSRGRVSRIELVTIQSMWWVDKHGTWHDVAKIDAEYRLNLLDYLLRNAPRIKYVHEFQSILGGPLPYGDAAQDAFDDAVIQLLEQEPREWMQEQPLVERLVRLTIRDRLKS